MVVRINNVQTKEERRLKYAFLRYMGVDYKTANRVMDWTPSHIAQFLNSSRENLKAARLEDRHKNWRKTAFGERREWRCQVQEDN